MKITNTKKQDPTVHLTEALLFGDGAIEASEARGQRELAVSSQLPVDGSEHPAFAAMGIVFGPPCEDDEIFRPATLPAGWQIVPVKDHAMWSRLCDEKGNERAEIFYKAAFYDRHARIIPLCRFMIERDYSNPDQVVTRVTDRGKELYTTLMVNADAKDYTVKDKAAASQRAECRTWLVTHYPNYEDPATHWDDV